MGCRMRGKTRQGNVRVRTPIVQYSSPMAICGKASFAFYSSVFGASLHKSVQVSSSGLLLLCYTFFTKIPALTLIGMALVSYLLTSTTTVHCRNHFGRLSLGGRHDEKEKFPLTFSPALRTASETRVHNNASDYCKISPFPIVMCM